MLPSSAVHLVEPAPVVWEIYEAPVIVDFELLVELTLRLVVVEPDDLESQIEFVLVNALDVNDPIGVNAYPSDPVECALWY